MSKIKKMAIEIAAPSEANDLLTPRIDFCSNKEAVIDGCSGIIEYNSEIVRLNCKTLILKFIGTDLTIKADSIDQVSVSGDILTLEFCSL